MRWYEIYKFLYYLCIFHRDISGTSITMLPAAGLVSLEVLRAENVISMKTIPSIHEFKVIIESIIFRLQRWKLRPQSVFLQYLREAWLTHHFHCCAFHFPELHDPVRHEQYLAYVAKLQKVLQW